MLDAGPLDELMDRVDGGGLALTGASGFLPEMIKAVLERGLQTELTEHLGYEKGDPAGRGSPNSRNGTTPKIPFLAFPPELRKIIYTTELDRVAELPAPQDHQESWALP